ncbi:MAG: hypothetical protein CSB21_01920 [Deltaproteobacteria bacterium]|nr:MAG: hypothetical protein CSB21_01920 [Deltaproteobacteria bacterium]
MKIKCPECGKVYNINQNKLPEKPIIKIRCKSCNQPFSFKNIYIKNDIDERPKIKKEDFLKNTGALPPVPEILIKAREIVNDDKSSAKDLAVILEKDQAMASRILKIANSAYYSLRTTVNSVQQACILLGSETLLQMITLATTSKMLAKELKGYSISSGEVFIHSTGVGFAAQSIAERSVPSLKADAFSAGILHDAGKLIIDNYLFEHKETFVPLISSGLPNYLAEREILGFDHSEIGHDFLKSWNIPANQCCAIKWHHEPLKSDENQLAYILHTANALVLLMEDMPTEQINIDDKVMDFLGLDFETLDEIRQNTKKAIQEIFIGFIS